MLDEVDSLLLGRKTYDLMESFWPGEQGQAHSPQIADRMHHHQELVASHHEFEDAWSPTRRLSGDLSRASRI